MDAITFLKQEHSRFRKDLTAIKNIKETKAKKAKFDAFCVELIKHETMEQKVWYPALRKYPELRDTIQHLLSEEKSASQAIKKFQDVSFDFMWELRFYKFKHDVNHHAKEEEKELFPKVKTLLNQDELKILGQKMKKFKDAL